MVYNGFKRLKMHFKHNLLLFLFQGWCGILLFDKYIYLSGLILILILI